MEPSRLTPRQREILRAVVEDYILTAEPVGSRTLCRKYQLGLSPATIRNELADLEEGGLLRQPHTSAGRIPSDFGYRVFVDILMGTPRIPPEKQEITLNLQEQATDLHDLHDLLYQTARITAILSGCTALVRSPRQAGSCIKTISLLPVGAGEVLLVLVASNGVVTNCLLSLPGQFSSEEILLLSNFLDSQLRDRPLDSLTYRSLSEISAKLKRYQALLEKLWARLAVSIEMGEQVIISHASILACQPEFHESLKMGALLAFLERESRVVEVMDSLADEALKAGAVKISIGTENREVDLVDCSLVT
ncbi:MAG: heat-inducible transcription repressor HrcA, partial [Cyanobacteria bacterium NC_groundwater_1444_Ag_S-0.65um_54_12]|nr:heat-inducible transcription repressor HrcA [Cyanobacteria bacterium NC_groundwater_1444_Ag_S-0.65um_54_12]